MKGKISFEKVKILENGYLADGVFIPKDISNRHYKNLLEWINSNSIEDEIDIGQIRNQKILDIKNEASRQIISHYSEINQKNILMSQNAKMISKMNNFIKKIRHKSNLLEQLLKDMNLSQLNNFDASHKENWS